MKVLSEREQRVIARILKVNHGGEHGAIRIYGAQIAVAEKFYPDIVPILADKHLVDQLAFLQTADPELFRLISSIRDEEVSHLENAIERRGAENVLSKFALCIIGLVTDVLIWMSTSGDLRRLKFELGRVD